MVNRVVIALMALTVSILTTDAFASVGRTSGTFDVSAAGSAQYTIPIWVPPGIKGLQPILALSYNSNLGYGLMGPGWTLTGLSTISRCNRTYAQDGTPAAVTLTYADAFCLDGNRLRLTSSENLATYGQAGTTYQTEIANFSNVTASSTLAGNGPSYFTVKGKDGLTYEYGNTTDSKILAAGSPTPYIWALDRVTDRSGNQMIYTYLQSGGAYVPATIKYTAPSGSTSYPYTVSFGYSPKATNDYGYFAVAGTQVQQTNQLSSIGVANSSVGSLRGYNLTYSTSGSTYRSTLTSIQECTGVNGGGITYDCLAPTNIVYQNSTYGSLNNGTFGVASPTTATGSGATNGMVYSVDIDGDGKLDLVYATGTGPYTWWVQLATPTGYGTPINTTVVTTGTADFLLDDFDATGGTIILAPLSGGSIWYAYKWNGTSFTPTSTGVSVSTTGSYSSIDVDGDGRPDIVNVQKGSTAGTANVSIQLNTTSGGAIAFVQTPVVQTISLGTANVLSIQAYGNNQLPNSSVKHFDFDGDGRQDLLLYVNGLRGATYTLSQLLSRGTGLPVISGRLGSTSSAPQSFMAVNWNDDNCTDVILGSELLVSNCDGGSEAFLALPATPSLALDWDGDGRTDLLANVGGTWQLYRSLGSSTVAPTAAAAGISMGSGTYVVTDKDGDGLHDIAYANSAAGNAIYYGVHNGAGVHPDLATSFTDGYGLATNVIYVSIAQSNYTPRPADSKLTPDPGYRVFTSPFYVVSEADFIGPNSHKETYSYSAAWANLQGRGFSGFGRVDMTDDRWSQLTHKGYWREFPFTGMIADLRISDAFFYSHSETQFVPDQKVLDATVNNQRYFPFQSDIQQGIGGAGTNLSDYYSYSDTSYVYDNFGNATTVTTTLTDTGTTSPYSGESWTSTVVNSFLPDASTNWCLGLPTGRTVTNSSTSPGVVPITRTVAYNNPDYSYCRETEKVTEPSSPTTYMVKEDYLYDSFGNLQTDTVTGAGMTPRVTTLNWGTTGQFLIAIQNPLLQLTSLGYDVAGNLTFQSDPNYTSSNPIATTWKYGAGYNRKSLETRPDGTSTTWTYNDCATNGCVNTGNKMTVTETVLNAGGSIQSVHNAYLNWLDKPLVVSNLMQNGAYDRVEMIYDNMGNVQSQSAPCPFSGCPAFPTGWYTYGYDEKNRLTNIDRPVSDTNNTDVSTHIYYFGLETAVTDANNITVVDHYGHVNGVVGRSIDATGYYYQDFYYDAFGSLLSVTDAASNALFTATYDYGIDAFQRNATDMDLDVSTQPGKHRQYTYDALGELTHWSDAKGQSFSMSYDVLSRPRVRTEPDLTTTWNWGSSAAIFNIGKLASVTSVDSSGTYLETYSYDSKTRPSVKTITIPGDTSYAYAATYNATTGLLDTLQYPASTSSYQLKLQYSYINGILKSVSDFNAPATVFWTANVMNTRGQVTQETLGNGVVTNRHYDGLTGWLGSIQSGVGGGAGLQNNSYLHDYVGNVTQRQNGTLTENFYYDANYRLDHSTLGNATNLQMAYEAVGNIFSRSDVANNTAWTYDPVKQHAVTQAGTGGYSYTYDNNGNATSRNGYPITWTSYNYPDSVGAASESAQFWYGPDRQRYKTMYSGPAGIETTYHVGKLMGKVASSGATDYRHYIFAGSEKVAIYDRSTSGTNTLYYALSDHQGSIASVVSNSTPGPVASYVTESFTAFGNLRNGATWSGAPTAIDTSRMETTSRDAYTGQTVLGVQGLSMGLNHMNGRVQDAVTGRFLSPDPHIPDPGNTQSFNRYSYVNNNPVTFSDPTGFDPAVDEIVVESGGTNPVVDVLAGIVDIGELFGLFGGGGGPTLTPMQQAEVAHGIDLRSPLQGTPSFESMSGTTLATEDGTSTVPHIVVEASRAPQFAAGFPIGGAIAGGSVFLNTSEALTNITDITQASANGTPNRLGEVTVSAQRYAPFDFSKLLVPTVGIPEMMAQLPEIEVTAPYPKRLFGTHWCGAGGGGPPVNDLDAACKAHDGCYGNIGFSAESNFNNLSATNAANIKACNQLLCDSVRQMNTRGSGLTNFWFSFIVNSNVACD
jgi:RHS repeat-associated protein